MNQIIRLHRIKGARTILKRRMTLVVGGLLLLVGCAADLYLIAAITSARLVGISSTALADAPSRPFAALNCPLLLSRNETSQVSVVITNPTQDNLDYSVGVSAAGFTIGAPNDDQIVTVGNQATMLMWPITAEETGNQAIVVHAFPHLDRPLSEPFHTWPAFLQGCGVFVIDAPLSSAQLMGLSGLSTAAGIVLIFPWLSRRWRKRKTGENDATV